MSNRAKGLLAFLLLLILILVVGTQEFNTTTHKPRPTTTIPGPRYFRCEEDMDCWDCHVDGNKICGPTP